MEEGWCSSSRKKDKTLVCAELHIWVHTPSTSDRLPLLRITDPLSEMCLHPRIACRAATSINLSGFSPQALNPLLGRAMISGEGSARNRSLTKIPIFSWLDCDLLGGHHPCGIHHLVFCLPRTDHWAPDTESSSPCKSKGT